MTLRKLMLSTVAATAVSTPVIATADSDLSIALAGSASAQANLDFAITIPSFIFFQVGSPGSTIDSVSFDLLTANEEPGSTNPVAGSSTVSVALRTNATNVRIAASGGNMTDTLGGAGSIPLTDITPSSAASDIPVPDFGADTGLIAPSGFNLSDTWSFSYDNTTVVPAGVYGTDTNGGRVTYTVTDF